MDLSILKRKINELSNKNTISNRRVKIQEGDNILRIVPYVHDKQWPFRELYFLYGVNNRTYLSPVTFGDPDPFAEASKKIRQEAGEDEEMRKFAYHLGPKKRFYAPVIIRGQESEGVKFWGFSQTIMKELLSYISDPDYGDITDIETGRDIVVHFEKPSGGGFPKTTLKVKPSQRKAVPDNLLEILDDQPKIEELFDIPSYAELEEALKQHINSLDGDESSHEDNEKVEDKEEETFTPSASKTSKSKSKKTTKPKSVDTSNDDDDDDDDDTAMDVKAQFQALLNDD